MSIAFSFAPRIDTAQDIVQSSYIEFLEEARGKNDHHDLLQVLRRVTHRVPRDTSIPVEPVDETPPRKLPKTGHQSGSRVGRKIFSIIFNILCRFFQSRSFLLMRWRERSMRYTTR